MNYISIWRHRFGSTSVQVTACCVTASSQYLNQCWLLISEVRWHDHEQFHSECLSHRSLEHVWKLYFWNYIPGANELKSTISSSCYRIRMLENMTPHLVVQIFFWLLSMETKYIWMPYDDQWMAHCCFDNSNYLGSTTPPRLACVLLQKSIALLGCSSTVAPNNDTLKSGNDFRSKASLF